MLTGGHRLAGDDVYVARAHGVGGDVGGAGGVSLVDGVVEFAEDARGYLVGQRTIGLQVQRREYLLFSAVHLAEARVRRWMGVRTREG